MILGGHLASTAATHFRFKADPKDTTSVRPDFAILVYPVISFDTAFGHIGSRNKLIGTRPTADQVSFFSNELQVTRETPPIFIVHASDDATVPVENSIRFYQACVKNKVRRCICIPGKATALGCLIRLRPIIGWSD
jgi:hypothetical protein